MEDLLYGEIGKLVKKARKIEDITQEELSSRAGISRGSIANIERGNQKLTIYTLYLIADALRIEPAALLPPLNIIHKSESNLYIDLSNIKDNVTADELEWIKTIKYKSKINQGEE